jgi:glycosyltransferase involved in cell wall biosynthesis
MACEIPVLGTDSGGIREVVLNGVTGFLCEVGDTETMAARAIEVLTDETRARDMGRRGRERVISHFSKERIVGQYEDLYRELIA